MLDRSIEQHHKESRIRESPLEGFSWHVKAIRFDDHDAIGQDRTVKLFKSFFLMEELKFLIVIVSLV